MELNRETIYLELPLEVEFTYTRRRPAVMYLRNGDPGYPEEPAELEVSEVTLNGKPIGGFLTDAQHQQIEELIYAEIDREQDEAPELFPGTLDELRDLGRGK